MLQNDLYYIELCNLSLYAMVLVTGKMVHVTDSSVVVGGEVHVYSVLRFVYIFQSILRSFITRSLKMFRIVKKYGLFTNIISIIELITDGG